MPKFGEVKLEAHATSHQDGGSDEVNVQALSGELADSQPSTWAKVAGKPSTFAPSDHASVHQNGGGDEISLTGLSGVLADKQDADHLQGRDVISTAPTDGQALRWDGANSRWAPGTPAGYTVIHDQTLTEAADYVDITDLDSNAAGFYELILILIGDDEGSVNIALYINEDYTETHYYNQYLRAQSTAVTAARDNTASIIAISQSESGFAKYTITRDVLDKARAFGQYEPNSGISANVFLRSWICTETVTNITSLRLDVTGATKMGIGTRIILLAPPL